MSEETIKVGTFEDVLNAFNQISMVEVAKGMANLSLMVLLYLRSLIDLGAEPSTADALSIAFQNFILTKNQKE